MEFQADIIFHDCKYAISKHSSQLQGEEFRISWWTIISLLRAIGHVLDKVDSLISEKHKKIIDAEFKKLKASNPKPEIYWGFIEKERNKFLKEYKYGIRRQLTHSEGSGETKSSISIIVDNTKQVTWKMENSYQESFINDGYFKGLNEQQLAYEAVFWWERYISNIKRLIAES